MSSTNKRNKVKFNICNVHYAPLSQDNDGKYTWATPVALPGAVSLSLDPQGEPESFYADGIEYYVINNNQGYDGDLEVALIPESFRRDILMETTDANSVLLENAASETGKFALLFEFDGDVRKIRHVLYNCSASRPSISAKTNEENREVQTETLTVKARPLSTGYVKAKTGEEDIKARFLAAFNQLLNGKDALLEDCRVMQDHLTNCSAIDAELDELLREIAVVTELTQRCIQENARNVQSQEEYAERYNGYVARYEKAKARMDAIQEQKKQRQAKADLIGRFMFALHELEDGVTEFDNTLWLAVVRKATAYHDGRLVFTFQNEMEIEV